MTRQIIRGETVPLERFPDEVKRRAQLIGQRAMSLGFPVPEQVSQIMSASAADLQTEQLRDMHTYRELDEWVERHTQHMLDADEWYRNLSI